MCGDHSGKMSGSACAGDDHANAAVGSFAGIVCGSVGRAVGRRHVYFVVDAESLERLPGLAHDFKIRVASHHD